MTPAASEPQEGVGRLAHLFRFPVKSIGGEELAEVTLTPRQPLPGDRRFGVLHQAALHHLTEGRLEKWLPKSAFLRGAADKILSVGTLTSPTKLNDLVSAVDRSVVFDKGFDGAVQAQQVYGGHGYIAEWGMEQFVRDARIGQIYEGTNGIQALDYIRRKLLGDGGAELSALQAEFSALCDAQAERPTLKGMATVVQARLGEWRELSAEVIAACQRDPQEIGATSVDFLQYSAYVLLAGFWLQAAARAQDALEAGSGEAAFYQAKLHSADFYLRRVLPRASAHREALLGGAPCLMVMDEDSFAF
mgnify:CR=1 FL=1